MPLTRDELLFNLHRMQRRDRLVAANENLADFARRLDEAEREEEFSRYMAAVRQTIAAEERK